MKRSFRFWAASGGKRLLPIRLAKVVAVVVLIGSAMPDTAFAEASTWRAWDAFRQRFIQSDGRVIEHEAHGRTTSEGQAYAMFFALVSNDLTQFEQLLLWTANNLAEGNLKNRLPGWHWGKSQKGEWRTLDDNSAADADLWMAYALLEAGRLWQVPRYREIGLGMLELAREKEILILSNGLSTLLPGPVGFELSEGVWRLNPAYLVPQQFAAFARSDPAGPWRALETQLPDMLAGCCPTGFAPDWMTYRRQGGWQADQGKRSEGSHDAIRVYLWAGMMDKTQPGRDRLLSSLHGMHGLLRTRNEPPEKVDIRTGRGSGKGSPGFVAALLPYLHALGDEKLVARSMQQLRVAETEGLYGIPPRYYDQALVLFGLGYMEQRYRFSRCGALLVAWNSFADDGC